MPAEIGANVVVNAGKLVYAREYTLTGDSNNPGTLLTSGKTYTATTSASTTSTTETDVITKKLLVMKAPRDGEYVIRAVARYTMGCITDGLDPSTTLGRIQIVKGTTVIVESGKDSVTDTDGTEDKKYVVQELVAEVTAAAGDEIYVSIVLSAYAAYSGTTANAKLYHDPDNSLPVEIYVEVAEA